VAPFLAYPVLLPELIPQNMNVTQISNHEYTWKAGDSKRTSNANFASYIGEAQ